MGYFHAIKIKDTLGLGMTNNTKSVFSRFWSSCF